ncbi:MAG: MATE family efflux transporter [Bullifex sp.]|nr:MATE family efflux transporter [Spirochaetales bacterium]MDY3849761.1 MATE family efflux transporter [Bullifex sp.]
MQKTNIMQSETIPRLLFKMSFPMMLSMLIQALYNVVDSIFVAMVSETALTAVSLAFPLQNLLIAAAVGTGVGVNSLLSRRLGEGRTEEANAVASSALFLALALSVIFIAIGLFLAKPFLALFTDSSELLELSASYSRICLIISFGCMFSITIEKLIQATGNSVQPMTMQLTGAIMNIVLDPVFIFFFGLGVNGAAIATVLGQIGSMVLAFIFLKKNSYITIRLKDIRPKAKIIGEIYQVGLPTIIMNSIGTVMVSVINAILIGFSATAVSVFGVYFKLQSFVFMPVFGLNNGIIPILGFNYGARNRKRMTATMKLGLVVALTIMILGTLLFQLFPSELLSLFSASEEMYAIGIPALRIISLCFIPAAISIILISSFQATGFGLASMMVSIIRQLLVLCPAAFILSRFFGINGVWASFALAECFGLTFSVIFFIHVYKTRIRNLERR